MATRTVNVVIEADASRVTRALNRVGRNIAWAERVRGARRALTPEHELVRRLAAHPDVLVVLDAIADLGEG